MTGALLVLQLTALVLTIPAGAYACAYARSARRNAARSAAAAFEASLSSRVAVADADQARRLLRMARCRYAEAGDADIAEMLAPPLRAVPALLPPGILDEIEAEGLRRLDGGNR